MGRKGESITLSLKDHEKRTLEELAREYGMMWGDRPNISQLLKSIAARELLIAKNHDWDREKITTLNNIRKILIDSGNLSEAKLIARILCDRSELNAPFKQEIDNFLHQPLPCWRQEIDNLINRNQPFKLVYQDASDRIWQYTVLYAKVEFIEKRLYLLCRCEEREGNLDVEELRHNWSLRLDRIKEAEIIEIDRNWENNLQQVTVEFHLFGGLVSNYESKPEDISIEVKTTLYDRAYKKVVRNVFSTFWFFRDIARYWGDCEIVSPLNIREKFITEKLQSLNRNYQ
jgi:hypothetical protein